MEDNKFLQGNIAIALYMEGVIIAGYLGEKGGYFNSQIIDFGKSLSNKKFVSYTNNQRYCSDICLKYHNDANWQTPVIIRLINENDDFLNAYVDYLYKGKEKGKILYSEIWEIIVNHLPKL